MVFWFIYQLVSYSQFLFGKSKSSKKMLKKKKTLSFNANTLTWWMGLIVLNLDKTKISKIYFDEIHVAEGPLILDLKSFRS